MLGTVGKTTAQTLLYDLLTPRATVHAQEDARNTTPQIMMSLASLRLTDQPELLEIALRNRPTVTRHRMGAAAPDICLITAFDLPDTADEKTISGWIE